MDGRDVIARVLGRTPSGVFVLSAGDNAGRETGMLASWVQQASFDPPTVTVAIHKQRYLHDWLKQRPALALSIIAKRQFDVLRHFSKGFAPDERPFETLPAMRGKTGLPVLSDALGYLEGPVISQVDAGDHIVYVMRIDAAGAAEDLAERQPMVHIRKNGFNY